jgi:hypothetical protein
VRIALLHPTGADPLARDLLAADADVTLLRGRPLPRLLTGRRGYDEQLGLVPTLALALVRDRFDVAHAFFAAGAWAATKARRLGGPPVIFTLTDPPTREQLVARRYRLALHTAAARAADACTVPSPAAAEAFTRYLLRAPELITDPAQTLALYRRLIGGQTP